MPLRIIEATVPDAELEQARKILAGEQCLGSWSYDVDGPYSVIAAVLQAEDVEGVLDSLSSTFQSDEGFRAIVFSAEAMRPRPPEPDKPPESAPPEPKPKAENQKKLSRISRDELYERIHTGAALDRNFLLQVALSTAVAVIGLLYDDLAVIIGAMVIAPLLGPNVALALATVLADGKLALQSLRTNLAGVLLATILAFPAGLYVAQAEPAEVSLNTAAIEDRTEVGLQHIVLACASGAAGVLAFTTGAPASLIGVMVAVALLPPTAVFGMLAGAGDYRGALQALFLLAANVVCVNLSAVATFALKGVRPRRYWEESGDARVATRLAVIIWGTLLLLLLLSLAFREELSP